eukprot:TRINITY_DN9695_c0_g1_i1.p1 TRINITY_DN9695_c0_g1~~TRINITY_DN9695_c0_g1_i1.p1  ORF type:complete len:439 (-),score=56.19 TRINITY_DN9695_c0_g1_i1:56-1240(-)
MWDLSYNSEKFWLDWATAQFGANVAEEIATLFSDIESFNLPRPVNWIGGPGGFVIDHRPWSIVQPVYAFIDNFIVLESKVTGLANRDRYSFWLNSFLYVRSIAKVDCSWGAYDTAITSVLNEKDPIKRKSIALQTALPALVNLVSDWGVMIGYLQSIIKTTGEMGTMMNVEQHNMPVVITYPTADLESIENYIGCYVDTSVRDLNGYQFSESDMTPGICLDTCRKLGFKYAGVQYSSYCFCGNTYGKYGSVSYQQCNASCSGNTNFECGGTWRNTIFSTQKSLSTNAYPSPNYQGTQPYLIVPTVRTSLAKGEDLNLFAMVLSASRPSGVTFYVRPLGSGDFKPIPFVNIDRQLYTISYTPSTDFEYYIQAEATGKEMIFPVTAPAQAQTVIVA